MRAAKLASGCSCWSFRWKSYGGMNICKEQNLHGQRRKRSYPNIIPNLIVYLLFIWKYLLEDFFSWREKFAGFSERLLCGLMLWASCGVFFIFRSLNAGNGGDIVQYSSNFLSIYSPPTSLWSIMFKCDVLPLLSRSKDSHKRCLFSYEGHFLTRKYLLLLNYWVAHNFPDFRMMLHIFTLPIEW